MARLPRTSPGTTRGALLGALLALSILLAAGCGSDDSSSVFEGERTFWSVDFTNDNTTTFHPVRALPALDENGDPVGTHCYVYVEVGRALDAATARAVAAYFDNVVYPSLTSAFGQEPNPTGSIDTSGGTVFVGDADRDPRIYLLLMDIRDGYTPEGGGGATLGYFYSWNETAGAYKNPSNRKEILFFDMYPGEVGSGGVLTESFKRTLAHEFQHMIHWEQKTHRAQAIGATGGDDAWLNEAMSMTAPAYCGLGTDREHLAIFERYPTNSLVEWNGLSMDYAVVWAWGEFLREHCSDAIYDDNNAGTPLLDQGTVFRAMLGNDEASNTLKGIASVNAAFGFAPSNNYVFQTLFRNWTLASFYGTGRNVPPPPTLPFPDNTYILYSLFDTWRSAADGVWTLGGAGLETLGLLNGHAPLNLVTLPVSGPWSFGVFRYDGDVSSSSNGGQVTWVPTDNNHSASFVDGGTGTLILDAPSDNTPCLYTDQGWLVVRNDRDLSIDLDALDNVVWSGPGGALRSPLAASAQDPGARLVAERTGRPYGVCVQSWLQERARRLSASPSR